MNCRRIGFNDVATKYATDGFTGNIFLTIGAFNKHDEIHFLSSANNELADIGYNIYKQFEIKTKNPVLTN
jgi:hypothetical protein